MYKRVIHCPVCMAKKHGYKNPKLMLKTLYAKMTPKEMAEKILKVSLTTVMNWLHFYKIEIRPRGSAGRI